MEPISASAASKIILAGEHFVVNGCPAIALPLPNCRLSVQISPTTNPPTHPPLIHAALEICQKHLGGPGTSLHLHIHSQIPQAFGMGSSAALSVAIPRAYSQLVQKPLSTSQILKISMEIEQIAHGTASGIDSTTITYEQPLYFLKNQPPQFLQPAPGIALAILSSQTPSKTKQMVNAVQNFRRQHPHTYNQLLQQAKTCVEQTKNALLKGDPNTLAQWTNHNQNLLQQIGVHTPKTQQLIQLALQCGALGAKTSGGGGGGIVLAITSPPKLSHLCQQLQKYHIPILSTLST
ncbi:MAG: mevalonate kinase [Planctomycetota bacterium]|nr:MAG: mevalonate kinase [Planctomycetota bacterium]